MAVGRGRTMPQPIPAMPPASPATPTAVLRRRTTRRQSRISIVGSVNFSPNQSGDDGVDPLAGVDRRGSHCLASPMQDHGRLRRHHRQGRGRRLGGGKSSRESCRRRRALRPRQGRGSNCPFGIADASNHPGSKAGRPSGCATLILPDPSPAPDNGDRNLALVPASRHISSTLYRPSFNRGGAGA